MYNRVINISSTPALYSPFAGLVLQPFFCLPPSRSHMRQSPSSRLFSVDQYVCIVSVVAQGLPLL